MPIYEYRCTFCEHRQEEIRCMADREKPLDCVKCDGSMVPAVSAVRGTVKNPAAGPSRKWRSS